MTLSVRAAIAGALLVGALLVLQFRSTGEAVPIRKSFDTFPSTIATWRERQSNNLDLEIVSLLKVNDYVMRLYANRDGRTLWLYIGYWSTQRKGAQIHSPRNCLPGGGWEPIEASRLVVTLPGGRAPIEVNRYLIQKDRDQQVVLYWYQSQGKAVAGELAAKIEMVRSAITRNRTDGALVRVSAPVSGGVAETTESLVRYVQALYPVLGEYLPE
jgi:EpsI family protein